MSALPKAVQKQVDDANKLAAQLAQDRNILPPNSSPPPDDASGDSLPGEPAVVEGWEQKYKVLQGKYNAEVPRLQRQVNDQTATIEDLRRQINTTQLMLTTLNQNRGAASGNQGAAPAAPSKLVKDEEVREFGEDLTDFIRRVAQDSVLPAVEQKLQPVQQQVEQVRTAASQASERVAHNDREQFFATLDSRIEGWRQQNEDEGFLNWLAQPDAYTGVARQELLQQAVQRLDVPRVMAFFMGYRNENAVVTPPSSSAASVQGAPQRTLDSFVAPGTPKAGATGAQDGAGKRVWTQLEIKQFYTDAAAGKYRTNKQRRDEIERDIHAAVRDGRVR